MQSENNCLVWKYLEINGRKCDIGIFSMKAVGNNIGYYENVIIFSQSPIIANYSHILFRAIQPIPSLLLHFEYLAQFI